MAGEDRFVRRLLEELPASRRVVLGPGDDAAVVAVETGLWVVTTDMVVEAIDFLPGDTPEAVGRRAMAVNLSDLAAMGARPEFFLLSIAFPARRGEDFPLSVARGALSRATPVGAALVGGDLSDAQSVVVSIALWGRPEGEPTRRAGARAGDLLFLSGAPGRAAAGLVLARAQAQGVSYGGELNPEARAELLAAYRDPEPRLALGLALARQGQATAAIDISDGVGIDSGRLARASGLRAVIEEPRLPISPALAAFARFEGRDPLELLLAGGDDYELLFAVAPERAAEIPPRGPGGVPLSRIGHLEPGEGAFLRSATGDRDISGLGHDHLSCAP
ncbi:MAG TPA: thiamine-phosphate kinase [Thermoanaerobaculia bacterium]|nr:thiamine-phosphate kinase [Thermoanaerobaculia bacterium]